MYFTNLCPIIKTVVWKQSITTHSKKVETISTVVFSLVGEMAIGVEVS